MSRILDCDLAAGELQIRFPYDVELLRIVRDLPERRWDNRGRYWCTPHKHLAAVARVLLPLGFQPSETVRRLLGEGGAAAAPESAGAASGAEGEALASAPAPPHADLDPPAAATLSISRLNELVRAALHEAFPQSLWLAGEVIGYDRNAHKRHIYFQLAEKEEGEDRPRAVVSAVLFEGVAAQVAARLRSAAEPLELRDGVKIRVRGRIDLYPPTGSYQIIVEEVDPDFTLGEIARRRERILAEIERLGLRRRNLELAFPLPSLRIGLITSYASDAYNDFVSELSRSSYSFAIDAYDVHVQGKQMEDDVLRALRWFAANGAHYDAVAIVRGGGARTDLMYFDSLDIGVAVARLPIKVIVGIGHERDRSVLDHIAHSEKTPTAAAQLLIAIARAEEDKSEAGRAALVQRAERLLASHKERLDRVALLLARSLSLGLAHARTRVLLLARDLGACAASPLARERDKLAARRSRLALDATRTLEYARRVGAQAHARLLAGAPRRVRLAAARRAARAARVQAADPRRILSRGFAWLRDAAGRSLKSVLRIDRGARIDALLSDGELGMRVEEVRERGLT